MQITDNKEFFTTLFSKHIESRNMPSNKRIANWAKGVLYLLFPERKTTGIKSVDHLEKAFEDYKLELYNILNKTKACSDCDNNKITNQFFNSLPDLYNTMLTDAQAIVEGDPAAQNIREVIRTYPGFTAICIFRLAHELWKLNVPLIPRILTEYAHSKTGIDIHPGAQIGNYLYIDHGTGLVIGETCIIGDHVKLYQGVTLGALSVHKEFSNTQRHPTIQDHVIIYAGATILGGNTIVGHHSTIGGNVWLTSSVDPYTTVYHQPNSKFMETKPIL